MLKQLSSRLVETACRQFEIREMVSKYYIIYDLRTGFPVAVRSSDAECDEVLNALKPGDLVPQETPPVTHAEILTIVETMCPSFDQVPKLGKLSTRCLQAILKSKSKREVEQLAAAALDAQELED